MLEKRPILENAPVDVALFQLKFDRVTFSLDKVVAIDSSIRCRLPKRVENYSTNIELPSSKLPIGRSSLQSNTTQSGYIYMTEDQKSKLTIEEDTLTYVEEHPYQNWAVFSAAISSYLDLLSSALVGVNIVRTSIRFINRFSLKEFSDPTEYFNTTISSISDNAVPYPLIKYGFKLTLDVNPHIYSIINQNLDKLPESYSYVFDIDVLDRSVIFFDRDVILDVLNTLNEIKDNIFFGNLTQKTIDLCK